MYANSKITAVLIINCCICNYVLLVQGKTLAAILAEKEPSEELGTENRNEPPKLESGDETPKPVTPSNPEKESSSSIPSCENSQEDTTKAPELLPQGNQLSPTPNQVTGEQISKVVIPRPVSLGGLFYSLLQFILGKIRKPKKPTEFEEMNSEAVYLFGQLIKTASVEDKTDIIKKVTDYIQRCNLYTGRYKKKSNFEKRFEIIETTRDGNCFYSAISLLFFGHESFGRGLRAITAAHMAINEEFLKCLIDLLQEVQVTWIAVLNVRKFAESVEIVFLSNILCRHIKVYESESGKWYQYALLGCESPKDPLHLHLHKKHFSAMRLKRKKQPAEAETFLLTDFPPIKIL